MKKHSDLAFRLKKTISLGVLRENREQFFKCEQKIIYAEKKVNNFVNNAEQKIILCKMLEIVYEKNSE